MRRALGLSVFCGIVVAAVILGTPRNAASEPGCGKCVDQEPPDHAEACRSVTRCTAPNATCYICDGSATNKVCDGSTAAICGTLELECPNKLFEGACQWLLFGYRCVKTDVGPGGASCGTYTECVAANL